MTRSYRIAGSIILILLVAPLVLIGSCVVRANQYKQIFSQIETGQSKQSITNAMGTASKVQSCNFPVYDANKNHIGDCFEIFIYKIAFHQWAVAFDKNGNVIEKYDWILGEYGKRPPGSN